MAKHFAETGFNLTLEILLADRSECRNLLAGCRHGFNLTLEILLADRGIGRLMAIVRHVCFNLTLEILLADRTPPLGCAYVQFPFQSHA